MSDCAHLQPPWQGTYASVPVVLSRMRLLLVPVQIDGRDVTGLFDSGSDRERVERSAVLRIGITDAMPARDRETGGFSAGGPSHPMRMHRFSALRIGNETFANPML